jgi:hypothetical protein
MKHNLEKPESSFVDVEALAQHSSSRIRTILASSSTTPPAVLRLLATDKNSSVMLAVALNPACPLDVLEMLSRSSDRSTRLGLASQLDVCDEILSALVTHRNPYLASQSKHALEARAFEQKLRDGNVRCVKGNKYKLGELLVGAGQLSSEDLEVALKLSREHKLLLGRVLMQTGMVSPAVLHKALKFQMLLRTGEIEFSGSYEMIEGDK